MILLVMSYLELLLHDILMHGANYHKADSNGSSLPFN